VRLGSCVQAMRVAIAGNGDGRLRPVIVLWDAGNLARAVPVRRRSEHWRRGRALDPDQRTACPVARSGRMAGILRDQGFADTGLRYRSPRRWGRREPTRSSTGASPPSACCASVKADATSSQSKHGATSPSTFPGCGDPTRSRRNSSLPGGPSTSMRYVSGGRSIAQISSALFVTLTLRRRF